MNLVAVGECTMDRYRQSGTDKPGGISFNFAVNAALGGARTALVSCTGDDGGGDPIRMVLERERVDVSHLHQRPGRTASQLIDLAEGGERIFPPGGYDPGVLADWRLDSDDAAFIATFDVVASAWFREAAHLFGAAMAAAKPDAKRVADLLDGADLGPDLGGLATLPKLDLAFVSGPPALADRLAGWAGETGTALVVTHGAAGSTALIRGSRFEQAAVAVPADKRIDTTGCGDAFQAGFTVAFFTGAPVSAALRTGAARAAAVIRHLGAVAD